MVEVLQEWACGAAGSALPWHGRGHRFDPDQVHQLPQQLRQAEPFKGMVCVITCHSSAFWRGVRVHCAWPPFARGCIQMKDGRVYQDEVGAERKVNSSSRDSVFVGDFSRNRNILSRIRSHIQAVPQGPGKTPFSPATTRFERCSEMITLKTLSLAEANLVIQAGIARATAIASPSTISVVDVSGTVIAQARMDGASLSSVELAYNKAFTSLSCRMATSDITKIAQPGGDFYGIANGLGGRAIIFPGGVPILAGGQVVGAVGASGGNGAQDEDVARAAADGFAGK